MPGFQLATRLNAPRHVATPDQALYTSNGYNKRLFYLNSYFSLEEFSGNLNCFTIDTEWYHTVYMLFARIDRTLSLSKSTKYPWYLKTKRKGNKKKKRKVKKKDRKNNKINKNAHAIHPSSSP